MKIKTGLLFAIITTATLASPAYSEEDPWENYNRAIFRFNEGMDALLLKPIAQGYDTVTPDPVQKGVSNFFNNLLEVTNITNNLLQGKWDQTASSTFRFLINSTAGWFGIFDVASELGLKRYEEDFGQTLGYWGVDSGPYVVLPFLGGSTLRDTVAMPVDWANYDVKGDFGLTNQEQWQTRGVDLIQIRAQYLNAEGFIFGDRYSFLRDVYLQSRAGAVLDGQFGTTAADTQVDDGVAEDGWGDESWEDDGWGDEEWDDETW